jgi:hypothetical protein
MNEEINNSISETVGHLENNDEQLRELIRKNYEMTEEIYHMTKKIKGYITFQKVMSFIYLVLIVGPIILSFIYLPALLKNAIGPYQELLNDSSAGNLQGILKNLSR